MEDTTLITVIQTEFANSTTMRCFFGYYREVFDIKNYMIILHGEYADWVKDLVAAELYPYGCVYAFHDWKGSFNDQDKASLINYHKMQADTDFTLVVDDDEYAGDMVLSLHREHPDADFISMKLMDRIGKSKELLLLKNCSTWMDMFAESMMFPVSQYFGCDTTKFAFTRKDLQLSVGQHSILNMDQLTIGGYGGDIYIHHFKWVEGLLEKLEHRLCTLDSNKNSAWYGEMTRQYIHLKKYGRFNTDLLRNGKFIA